MIDFQSLSFWEQETFTNDIDFLIVGSGIVGLSCSIYLKEALPNSKIVVLERGYLPSGGSSKNAGFACIGSSSEILDDLEKSDEKTVFDTLKKRWKGLEELKKLLGNSIDYKQDGSYDLFMISEKKEYLKCLNNLDKLNNKLYEITGKTEVFKNDENICKKSGFNSFQYAISNSLEGQIDTGKLIFSLLQKAYSSGVIILNGVEAKEISNKQLRTNFGNISFEKLAICNNGLASKFLPNHDLYPVRAQVVVSSPIKDLPFKGIFHFDKGYYYFRNIGDRVLLGGGRNLNFQAEETDELNTSDQIINHLCDLLESKILPSYSFTVDYQWAGTMGVGDQKAPIIEKVNDGIYCGVRLGGMGVAIGSLVGKELASLMTNSS